MREKLEPSRLNPVASCLRDGRSGFYVRTCLKPGRDGGGPEWAANRRRALQPSGNLVCVQVKEDKRTGRKDFMSVFDRKPR